MVSSQESSSFRAPNAEDIARNSFVHRNMSISQKWVDAMAAVGQKGLTKFVISLRPGAIPGSRASGRLWPRPIGAVELYYEPGSSDVGVLLGRAYSGSGLAREALHAPIDYLFSLKLTTRPADVEEGAKPLSRSVDIGIQEPVDVSFDHS